MSYSVFSSSSTPKATYVYNHTTYNWGGTIKQTISKGLYYILCAAKRSEKGGWPDNSVSIEGDVTIIDQTNEGGLEYWCMTRIVKVNSGTATVTFYNGRADRDSHTFQIVQIK